ncbi:3-demethylubiquinone-9 3-methyltransferase [Candidatus Magnetobacterium bavaricum]|uniref:3-demethylubiquinone-9 3-methyltransferase n=1 Tax=Candidatus Magnetobacterium bavaricum TaxID=29290 RepID=A0A0F3GPP4_9BACT|nr:3-demethylubiquinone-9 3-methyltransferase [Candidatus Magnetobacterium bavaricum]
MDSVLDRGGKQDALYEFPYHYIPTLNSNGDFLPVRSLRWGYEYISYVRFVLDRVRDIPFDTMLDVGCGDGRFLHEASRVLSDKQLKGVDVSARAVGFARAFNPNLELVVGDINDKALFSTKFDVITLVEVLEHIAPGDVAGFVGSIAYHLKDDGLVLLTVPSKNVKLNTKHYQHFDMASLQAALVPSLRILERHFINRVSILARMMERLLVNKLFILNQRHILNAVYSFYERHLLQADETNCKRICLLCQKQSVS